MDLGYAVFKGVLQGLTEFLPVSSTAHLLLTDHWWYRLTGYQVPMAEAEFFDILLHLGTLTAVLWYYRRDLPSLFSSRSTLLVAAKKPVWILLTISMSVTVAWIMGWLKGSEAIMRSTGLAARLTLENGQPIKTLSDWIEATPVWVALHLLVTGTLLYWTEHRKNKNRNRRGGDLDLKQAGWMGLAQGCAAIFHGVSRSGSTIATGLLCGLDRVTATQYSFLLSIPTFLMAAAYEFAKIGGVKAVSHLHWPPMLIGAACSALVGYFCIRLFLQFVGRYPLTGFALYCWIVGLCMLVSFGLLDS